MQGRAMSLKHLIWAGAAMALSATAAEVETPYYQLDLGDTWYEQVQEEKNGALVAIYANNVNADILTIAVVPNSPLNAKQTGTKAIANLAAKNGSAEPLTHESNYYRTNIEVQGYSGRYYFSEKDGTVASINIMNARGEKDFTESLKLIKRIDSKVSGLFPEL